MEGGGEGGEGCIGWWKATHDEGMGLACVEVGTGGERGAQQHPGNGKNKHKKEFQGKDGRHTERPRNGQESGQIQVINTCK